MIGAFALYGYLTYTVLVTAYIGVVGPARHCGKKVSSDICTSHKDLVDPA